MDKKPDALIIKELQAKNAELEADLKRSLDANTKWLSEIHLAGLNISRLERAVKAADEFAEFIDERMGNHALVINTGDQPDRCRLLLQKYAQARKELEG